MTDQPVPRAVANGRRVAKVLLVAAMVITVLIVLLVVNWWATRPIVI